MLDGLVSFITTHPFIASAIVVALIFDFVNGFHDSANAIATIVATKVLTPGKALLLAAVFNFIGPFLLGTAVAATIGKGIIQTGGSAPPFCRASSSARSLAPSSGTSSRGMSACQAHRATLSSAASSAPRLRR